MNYTLLHIHERESLSLVFSVSALRINICQNLVNYVMLKSPVFIYQVLYLESTGVVCKTHFYSLQSMWAG